MERPSPADVPHPEATAHRAPAADRVIVGIDDVPVAERREVLRFAAGEANRRQVDVWLVHGCEPLATATSPAPTTSLQQRRHRGEQLVAAAVEMMYRHLDPGRTVHPEVAPGSAVETLVELSHSAGLVVLQRRAVSVVQRWHTGSTSSRVCAQADCPVVVLPAGYHAENGRRGVVVGVDSRGHAATVLAVGFAEADLRSQPVVAVHGWEVLGPTAAYGYVPADPEELRLRRDEAEVELSEALAGFAGTHPDVPVERRVVQGPPRDVLEEFSATAELLVVGRHAQHGHGSLGLGGVARHCLQTARCPVVVVPPSRPARRHRPWLTAEVPIQARF